ncbi:MAG: glycosyltransferase family 2 protein [Actinomycetota bacterium]|nr:glycosyltransferase family 2 protein [Actinomycetota bacterium]
MTTRPPWISVIIPSHNRGELLRHAVASVLSQSQVDPNFEVVVVDDASDIPASVELADIADPRLRIVRSEHNIERGASRNLGARVSQASLLAFLDSDDEWHPEKLSRQIPDTRSRGASVTGMVNVDEHGRAFAEQRVPPSDAHHHVSRTNRFYGSGSSLVIDRASFDAVGGYPEEWAVQGAEDWVLLVRLARAGMPPRIVEFPGVRVRVHTGNSTADPSRAAVATWSALDLMEREGLVVEPELGVARQGKAVNIARQFARARRPKDAGIWLRRAWSWGTPIGFLRAAPLVIASGLASIRPRRGW